MTHLFEQKASWLVCASSLALGQSVSESKLNIDTHFPSLHSSDT